MALSMFHVYFTSFLVTKCIVAQPINLAIFLRVSGWQEAMAIDRDISILYNK